MGAFNVAVVIPKGGNPTVEHSVAIAMEPHRGKWGWYAIGGYQWPGLPAAVILIDGRWIEPDADWREDYVSEYAHDVIVVRCKG